MQKAGYAVLVLVLFLGVYLMMHDSPSGSNRTDTATPHTGSHTYEPHPAAAADEDGVAVYFSPKGGCQAAVVQEIEEARQTIDMQAYSFTSTEIEHALEDAQSRGVHVRAIIDREASEERDSHATSLETHHVETYTDGQHPIAHNKVIIIDGQTVITGSFNFTHQAENANAENLVIITGHPDIAAAYEKNFASHLSHSQTLVPGESRSGRGR